MRQLYFLFFLIIGSSGCYKTEVNVTEEVYEETPKVVIQETHIVNIIQDLNDNPISGTSIFNGKESKEMEYTYFRGEKINKYGERFEFINNDELLFSLSVLNLENQINYHNISVPSDFIQDTYKNQPFTILISDNISLQVEENAIRKNGNLITDHVKFYYKALESKDLNTYPLNIHMEGEQPKFINFSNVFYLAIDKNSLDYSIDASKWSLNGETPLYHFDRELNQWIKVQHQQDLKSGYFGTGELVDGHFVEIELKSNDFLENIQTHCLIDNQYNLSGRTSSLGKILFYLPVDAEVQMSVGDIQAVIHKETFIANQKVYAFEIQDIEFSQVYVDVVDCNLKSVEKALLKHVVNGKETVYLMGERDYVSVNLQDNNLHYFSILTENIESKALEYAAEEVIRLGRQVYCNERFSNYFIAESDNGGKVFTEVQMELIGDDVIITAKDGIEKFRLKFDNKGTGSYSNSQVNYSFQLPNSMDYALECFETKSGCGTQSFDLLKFDSIPEALVKGDFEGKFWISSITQSNVGYRKLSGSFQFYVQ